LKFKHEQGGICEVETDTAIERLKNNPEYTILSENKEKHISKKKENEKALK